MIHESRVSAPPKIKDIIEHADNRVFNFVTNSEDKSYPELSIMGFHNKIGW